MDKKILILNYRGKDSWGRQVYEDQYGLLWKDIDNRIGWLEPLYSCNNEFEGEPCSPMRKDIECVFVPKRNVE